MKQRKLSESMARAAANGCFDEKNIKRSDYNEKE